MKLKTYAKHIAKLAEKYPEARVVCAVDEEGNGFWPVGSGPTPGHFDDGEFYNHPEDMQGRKINAVCVN